MTRWEQTWAEAVLTAFVVDGSPGLNVTKGEVDYLSALRRMHSGGTALAAFGLRAAIWMVATAPLWLFGRFALFGTLARSERTELLCRLLSHKSFVVRELTLLLKLTAAFALLGTASVRARSHYDTTNHITPAAEPAGHPALQPTAASQAPARMLRVLP
jgi:hypothetical protein